MNRNEQKKKLDLFLSCFDTQGDVVKQDNDVPSSKMMQNLHFAGLSSQHFASVLTRLVFVVLLTCTLYAFGGPKVVFIIPAITLILEYFNIERRIQARRREFERDYPTFLLTLGSAIRTGLDPLAALLSTRNVFTRETVLSKELQALKERVDAGDCEEKIVAQFAATIDCADVALFRSAYMLSRKRGSSLCSCLERLARVTRQRQSFRRKIRGAVAMQKLSALGIGCCAVVIGAIQFLTNKDAFNTALAHPVGSKLLALGTTLIVVGIVWMMKMAQARV